MIPGTVSKLSIQEVSLTNSLPVTTDVIVVSSTTSTTVLTTLRVKHGANASAMVILVNVSGANMTTLTTGNIATAVTIGQNVATLLAYRPSTSKWYPGALA